MNLQWHRQLVGHLLSDDLLVVLDRVSKVLLERETIDAEQFVALLAGKSEDEVFADEEEPAKPAEPAAEPERPQREGARPAPRPRPGFAGGDAS